MLPDPVQVFCYFILLLFMVGIPGLLVMATYYSLFGKKR